MMAIHKVLVVDDSKTELMFLTDLLQKNGLSVRTAENADEAFKRLAEEKPRPDPDGRRDAGSERLPAHPLHHRDAGVQRHVPIIMCTSKNLETDRVWGMRQGARDYITKPVDPAELLAKIKALG
jgi:twitching motility two-component system response regulator PilH